MSKKNTKASKLISSKPLQAAGSEPEKSAKIGGIGNTPANHTPTYPKGGK